MEKPVKIAYFALSFPSKLVGYSHWATAMTYLEHCPSVVVYHDPLHNFYRPYEPDRDCIAEFNKEYPQYKGRVLPFSGNAPPVADGYIVDFLMGGAGIIDHAEKTQGKLLINMYNGGGFNLHDPRTDASLNRVLSSKSFFGGLIGYNFDYHRYLVDKNFPNWFKFAVINCGLLPPNLLNLGERDYFADGLINITFVGADYGSTVDKGFGQFMDTVRLFKELGIAAKFRLVGNWRLEQHGAQDLVDDIENHFYINFEQLTEVYLKTDIMLVPLSRNSHESFPNGATIAALLHGCLVVASDPRNSSFPNYIQDQDFVTIGSNVGEIVTRILEVVNDRERFYRIAAMGKAAARRSNNQVHRTMISVNMVKQLEAAIIASRHEAGASNAAAAGTAAAAETQP